MFEKPNFIFVAILVLLNWVFQRCYSKEINENSNFISCFDPPFEGLEIPGRGILMVHKGHRLIPLTIPAESEFCDRPKNFFELENDVWDNFTLVPRDHEEFSQLINDAKDVAENDEQIITALNELLTKDSGGAISDPKTKNNDMHVVNEPMIIPEHAHLLHDKSHPHAHTDLINKNDDEEISDLDDSLLLEGLNFPSSGENDGVKMRIFMFKEFCMDYLARKGLPLNINEEAIYSQENFEFFKSNWPTRDKNLVIDSLPHSIWKVFLVSGILTSQTATKMSEEMKRRLVLESLNAFFNGLEMYYLQNMESELGYEYYQYLGSLGIENALETIKYYRESEKLQNLEEDKSVLTENSAKDYSAPHGFTSKESSASSITTSSLEVPDTSQESSAITGSVSIPNNQYENSVVAIESSQIEASKRSINEEEDQIKEPDTNSQLESFAILRIKWFNIFVNDYLGRLGINFKISEETSNKASTIEFFKTELGATPSALPEVIWNIFMENGFEGQFPESISIHEKMNILNEIWNIFNQIENQIFQGKITAEGYLTKKGLFDVEIREIMRQYWDVNLNDTTYKLIHLSRQRVAGQEESIIQPVTEDELIKNQEKAKEMEIFNMENSQLESSMSGQESSVMNKIGSETEFSNSEQDEKTTVRKKRKDKKGKSKKGIGKKRKGKKGKKDKFINKEKNEKQTGILSKAKEFLDLMKKKEPDTVSEKSKENSSVKDISPEPSIDELEKSNESPLNLLKFGSQMKDDESEGSEFSERFGINSPSEKLVGNLFDSRQLGGEDSIQSKEKNQQEENFGNQLDEADEKTDQDNNEVSKNSMDLSEKSEKWNNLEQSPKKELNDHDVVPETTVTVNLLKDIPFADESINTEDSFKIEENEVVGNERPQVSEQIEEKNLEKLNELETKTISTNNDSEYDSVPNYQERSKVDYEPTAETSKEESYSAQNSQSGDEVAQMEENELELQESATGGSVKERPIKKKFSKLFENKLSSLFANTKKFFGIDKKPSKEDKKSSTKEKPGQVQDFELEDEFENLTNMVIYFIQSYAALRYKFVIRGVIYNLFDEINETVKSHLHFHQGTTEFDNVDLEKGIKKIAGLMGGGSFTAVKSIGLTAKDIATNLKQYLIKLFPTEKTQQEYAKNKKLNTTHFWLKQYFTHNLIKEGMLPEQLERPEIVQESKDLVIESKNQKSIEAKAETLCGKILPILQKFFDESLVKNISRADLDCLAVTAVNELYDISLSNSLFLFLFKYETNYWRFLTPDISISISQILKSE